jgi:hypothetical protein
MAIADNLMLDFQLVVLGTYTPTGGESQLIVNVMAYRRTTTVTAHSNSAFITAWRTLVESTWLAAVSANYNLDTLKIRCLNDAEDPFVETTVNSPGTIAGQSLPGFNAMVISRRSSIRGRWAQGRTYINGVPESASEGNTISAAQLVLLAALATDLNTAVVTAAAANNYVPSIFSQTYSTIDVNPTTVVNTQQATVEAQSVIGRMASRRSRVS